MMRLTVRPYMFLAQSNAELNPPKNQPDKDRRNPPGEPLAARLDRSSKADMAGLSVRETKAEITVETAIVSANCR